MDEQPSEHQRYWHHFYESRSSRAVPADPSAFAVWVQERLAPEQCLVEFGFGTARDALWFARGGRRVMGFDFADSAVQQAQGRADGEEVPAEFAKLDLYDTDAVGAAAGRIRDAVSGPAVYGRFLIHSLEDAGRHNLLDLAGSVLRDGGQLYLEFRTGQDREGKHVFGDDHFRVYLDPEVVQGDIEQRGGRVSHLETGHGLAPFKDEDPHCARLVAEWS